MGGDKILAQDDIIWRLERIRAGLAAAGVVGTLKIIGGSAMILGGLADRRSTVDIDAVVLLPEDVISRIAGEVAQERGWPPDWINLEAQGLYPAYAGKPLWESRPELSYGPLTVELATQEALLAMKLNASRAGRDGDDIRALMTACGANRFRTRRSFCCVHWAIPTAIRRSMRAYPETARWRHEWPRARRSSARPAFRRGRNTCVR